MIRKILLSLALALPTLVGFAQEKIESPWPVKIV